MEYVIVTVVGVAFFATGVLTGRKYPATVDEAIDALKSAEASAQATLTKIVNHKAG